MTDALVSQLDFQKAKDAEVAFINAQIAIRESQPDARRLSMDDEPMEGCFFLEIYSRIINLYFFLIGKQLLKMKKRES